MITRKIFLRNEKDIQEAAVYAVEKVKMDNIENPLFSEKDLIDQTEIKIEEEKAKFNRFLYKKIFEKTNKNKEVNLTTHYEKCVRDELFRTLNRNLVIKELFRIYKLHQKNNLLFTIKDIDYILELKHVISYLFINNYISFDFFKDILEEIANEKPKDFSKYGNGKVKQIKRDLEKIMYQEQK